MTRVPTPPTRLLTPTPSLANPAAAAAAGARTAPGTHQPEVVAAAPDNDDITRQLAQITGGSRNARSQKVFWAASPTSPPTVPWSVIQNDYSDRRSSARSGAHITLKNIRGGELTILIANEKSGSDICFNANSIQINDQKNNYTATMGAEVDASTLDDALFVRPKNPNEKLQAVQLDFKKGRYNGMSLVLYFGKESSDGLRLVAKAIKIERDHPVTQQESSDDVDKTKPRIGTATYDAGTLTGTLTLFIFDQSVSIFVDTEQKNNWLTATSHLPDGSRLFADPVAADKAIIKVGETYYRLSSDIDNGMQNPTLTPVFKGEASINLDGIVLSIDRGALITNAAEYQYTEEPLGKKRFLFTSQDKTYLVWQEKNHVFATPISEEEYIELGTQPLKPKKLLPSISADERTLALSIFNDLTNNKITLTSEQQEGLFNLLQRMKGHKPELTEAMLEFFTNILLALGKPKEHFQGKPIGLVALEVFAFTSQLEYDAQQKVFNTINEAALESPRTLPGAVIGTAFIMAKGFGASLETELITQNGETISADWVREDEGHTEIHEVKYAVRLETTETNDKVEYTTKLKKQFAKYASYLVAHPASTLVVDFIGHPKTLVLAVIEEIARENPTLAERIRVDVYTPFTGLEATYSLTLQENAGVFSFDLSEKEKIYGALIAAFKNSITATSHPLTFLSALSDNLKKTENSAITPLIEALTQELDKVTSNLLASTDITRGAYGAIRITPHQTEVLSGLLRHIAQLRDQQELSLTDGTNLIHFIMSDLIFLSYQLGE